MAQLENLSESTKSYIDMLNNSDLYGHCMDLIHLDYTTPHNEEELDKIKSSIEDKISLKREEMIVKYAMLEDYIVTINDVMENPDNYDTTEEDIEGSIKSCGDILNELEEDEMVLNTYLKSLEFSNMLKYRILNDIELSKHVSADIESKIKEAKESL